MSTERQLDGYGLDEQERAVKEWCRANGHRLLRIYREEAVSGKLSERDAWADALGAIEQGPAKGVVVPRLDRLARDVMVQETLMADVWRKGAEVYSTAPDENNLRDDPEEPSRKLIRRMMGIINEYDRDMIVLKLARGRRMKASKGGFAYGSPPFGYRAKNKTLVKDSSEQATLRAMLANRTAGLATRANASTLNKAGHRTKRGALWTSQAVSDVLRRHDNSPCTSTSALHRTAA